MENAVEPYDEKLLIEEAINNFAVLIDDYDYNGIINLMGIGKLQFLLRKQMMVELRGLRMALWRLAITRPFPYDANQIFENFLNQYELSHTDKRSKESIIRAQEYWGMLQSAGDADFRGVARHLISFLHHDKAEDKALSLKLALFIRQDYIFIFEHIL